MSEPRGNRREFGLLPGGGYVLALVDDAVRVEVRHLRRERHQLFGEMDVQCQWAGAQTNQGSLSCADLNLSSQTAREARGKYCAIRSKSRDAEFDWAGMIDEACRRVIEAERKGSAAIVLDDAPDDGPPRDFVVHGLSIPADSHSHLICDGDGLKSLTLLLILGEMAKQGIPVALLDWEWNAGRHAQRKRRVFGDERLDNLFYRRGHNSLAEEQDDIRRFCDEKHIQFIAIDSIGAACSGKLNDDDVARVYNRALDHLPPSLSAAHLPKNASADNGTDGKAFGSAFFSNYTRMSWKLKKQVGPSPDLVNVLYTPGKQNDGERRRPVCLEFNFTPDRIDVRNVDVASVDGFVQSLPISARLPGVLKAGAMTVAEIARELGANTNKESVAKSLARGRGKQFVCLSGPDHIDRWGLLERQAS